MMTVYLVCGVPGSGKTWVCHHLKELSTYLPHDEYMRSDYASAIIQAAKYGLKPILAECPFGERLLKDRLDSEGCVVKPYFIVEEPEVVRERYEARAHKEIPKAHLTRAVTIQLRADEWQAPSGTAIEIKDRLLVDLQKCA